MRVNSERILEVLTRSHAARGYGSSTLSKMAAVNSQLWSKISLCPRASSTVYRHQSITAITKILHRRHVSRVVQSATFMMKQEGELRYSIKFKVSLVSITFFVA